MGTDLIPQLLHEKYEIYEWKHACAILKNDFPSEWDDVLELLKDFRLRKSWLSEGGGNKSGISKHIESFLESRGWREKEFETVVKVDTEEYNSPTHKIDCFKNKIGLEIEWNNKDPFFDRDLNNFRLLFDLRAISVGVIITRCDELQEIFDLLGRGTSYGQSTTHMSKLLPKIDGGGGGGCPILVFGIRKVVYDSKS